MINALSLNRVDTPVISVIVPTFNSARYVRRCLDSLKVQTLGDFEVLVVDAGSRDETRLIVRGYDRRFRWLELPGSDQGKARNFGLKHSRGRYLTFLDSDDYYLPAKLESDVRALESNAEAEVTFCEAWHFRTERPDRMGLKKNLGQTWTLQNFLSGQNRNLNTMCFRRTVWERGFAFEEGECGRYAEEWRLQLALALGGVRMHFRADALVVVEARPDSHTTWAMQWIMKNRAVTELERVGPQLTAEQRAQYSFQRLLDKMRVKLVVALLLDGQWKQIPSTIQPIRVGSLKWKARCFCFIFDLVPHSWTRAGLIRYWKFFQDRSFTWSPATSLLVRSY